MEKTTMLGTEAAGEEEAKQEAEGLTEEPQAVQGGEDGHWAAPFTGPPESEPTQWHVTHTVTFEVTTPSIFARSRHRQLSIPVDLGVSTRAVPWARGVRTGPVPGAG